MNLRFEQMPYVTLKLVVYLDERLFAEIRRTGDCLYVTAYDYHIIKNNAYSTLYEARNAVIAAAVARKLEA